MPKCPECDGELERSSTKKKGMDVLKHKDPAAAKAAGCGVSFIPARSKGAAKNGTEEKKGTPAQASTEENGEQQSTSGGYREAVKRAGKRKQSGGRSDRSGAQNVQQATRTHQQPASTSGGAAKSKRGFFDDVTDFVSGKF